MGKGFHVKKLLETTELFNLIGNCRTRIKSWKTKLDMVQLKIKYELLRVKMTKLENIILGSVRLVIL